VLGVAALAATAAGALGGDRWTDERTVRFATAQQDLAAAGPLPAGGAGATFNWTMPANATAASFNVTLAFSGQALQGGSATVSVRATGPDGRDHPATTRSWTIPQGASSASLELNLTVAWADVPATLRDTDSGSHGLAWSQPLRLHVVVEAPSDLPVASYGFTAAASGRLTTYSAA
jgi:hypothetical protein